MHFEPLELRTLLSSYYVATTGNDAAAGTINAPWRTLQHAANMVEPGDVVTVRAGHYKGFDLRTSGTANQRIMFRAELGVIIDQRNELTPDGINLESASFVTIQRFTVVGLERAGIRSVANDGVQLLGNTLDKNGLWGILTGFSENVLIEGNVAKRSVGQHGIYVGNSADHPIIRGNVVWGNRQSGIQINSDASQGGDGIVTGALIENNTVYSNGPAGGSAINLDGVQSSVVRNNLLYDNHASGISLYKIDGAQSAKNNLVVNNTIVMANDEFSPGRYAVNVQDGSTGNVVRNNILFSYFPHDGYTGSIAVSSDSVSGFVSDFNVVTDEHGFQQDNGGMNLAQWRSTVGQDLHSKVLTPDVLFVDVSKADYHLKFGCAAIDAGVASLSPANDFSGNKRPSGKGIDIGAIEYQNYLAPTNVRAKATGQASIDVSWKDNTAGQANVVIYRRTLTGQYVKIKSLAAGVTSFRYTDVSAGTRYYYRIASYSTAGRSVSSDPAGATTWTGAPK